MAATLSSFSLNLCLGVLMGYGQGTDFPGSSLSASGGLQAVPLTLKQLRHGKEYKFELGVQLSGDVCA